MQFIVPSHDKFQMIGNSLLGHLLNCELPLEPEERFSLEKTCISSYSGDHHVTLFPVARYRDSRYYGFKSISDFLEAFPRLPEQMIQFSPIAFAAVCSMDPELIPCGTFGKRSKIIFPFVVDQGGKKRTLFVSVDLPAREGEILPKPSLYSMFNPGEELEGVWICITVQLN